MAPADFPFRSHHSFHLSLKNGSAHRAVSSGHLSCARTEKCHRQQFWPRENPTLSWFSLDLVRSYAVPFVLLGVWEARYGRVIAEEKMTMQRVDDSEKSDTQEKSKDKQQSTDPSRLDESKPHQ